jgi:hypothetical protein
VLGVTVVGSGPTLFKKFTSSMVKIKPSPGKFIIGILANLPYIVSTLTNTFSLMLNN